MPIANSSTIEGVQYVQFKVFGDERGSFSEIFRAEWFPNRNWESTQLNRSVSKAGVLRGLHYHYRQVDYWFPMSGTFQVGLVDLRSSSPTYLATELIDVDSKNPVGIYIPSGVAHGFLALTDAVLTYVVDQYFNASDELGVRWDDPTFAIGWQTTDPLVSARDIANPLWQDVPDNLRPV